MPGDSSRGVAISFTIRAELYAPATKSIDLQVEQRPYRSDALSLRSIYMFIINKLLALWAGEDRSAQSREG